MKKNVPVRLTVNRISFFLQLLAQGVWESAEQGMTVQDYLVNKLYIDPGYIAHRIQTIFLNGKAVDDVMQSYLQPKDTLALSAAMPGLVGATFRRSGFYSNLREQISHTGQNRPASGQTISFTLKLFNIIAKEIGPELFKRGVIIQGKRFGQFLLSQKNLLTASMTSQVVNGKEIDVETLLSMKWEERDVCLIILET